MNPYLLNLQQELYGNDFTNRVEQCLQMNCMIDEDYNTFNKILFSKEATLKTTGQSADTIYIIMQSKILNVGGVLITNSDDRLIFWENYWKLYYWTVILSSNFLLDLC